MEEEKDVTLTKRKATDGTGENSSNAKKTKTIKSIQERQDEFEQRIEKKIEEMGTKIDNIEETMGAKIKELGAEIMQQLSTIIQQQLEGIVSRVAELETKWGPSSSGGGPIKPTGKPYNRPPNPDPGALKP